MNNRELADHDEGLLTGLKVLDLSMHLSGPYGAMLMADLGADIVKIEPPAGDPLRLLDPKVDGLSIIYASINRNKRSLVLDLQQADGRALFLRLVEQADVVYNNFRPGVMDRLGLSFKDLTAVNPRIVMANLTGYGLDGPQRMAPAYDAAIQAVSGGMSITGHVGGAPARAGIPIADLAGGVFLALGVLAALRKADRTGEGVMLDLSLLDTQISLLMYWAGLALNTGIDPPPQGSGNVNVCPYGAFPTADGHVIIAIFSGSFWPKLCAALDRADLAADPRYADNTLRLEHRVELEAELEREFRRRTTAEWLTVLEQHDVPSGPVNSVSQAMAEPQVIARDMRRSITIDGRTLEFPGNPIKTSPDPTRTADFAPPPRLGQHSREILRERLGLDDAALAELVEAGVINREL